MIVTNSIRKVTQAIIDNEAANTLAMDIVSASGGNFSSLAQDLAIDPNFNRFSSYGNTIAMAALFMNHQAELMNCLEEVALADEFSDIAGYLESFTEGEDKDDVGCFLYLTSNPELFKNADRWDKQGCYFVMHTVVCRLVRIIAAYYNLQAELNKKHLDAYELGLAG